MGTQNLPMPSSNMPGSPLPVAPGETAATAVAAREKAAVEARFLVALHRPRNPDDARQRVLARCRSPRFASTAEYAKPVGGGKRATGASIRLAEELGRQWGNIDVQTPVVFDDDERRIIRVTATDLETNYSQSVDVMLEKTVERKSPRPGDEVLSSRQNSTGQTTYRIRADEDAFLVKQNANVAKARRQVILGVIPGDLVEEALEVAADTRRSEVRTDPAAARKRIADAFFSVGVMPKQLCDLLGKESLEAVTEAEIELLRSVFAAMKEGEATWTDVMESFGQTTRASGEPAPSAAKGAAALRAAIDRKREETATPPAGGAA